MWAWVLGKKRTASADARTPDAGGLVHSTEGDGRTDGILTFSSFDIDADLIIGSRVILSIPQILLAFFPVHMFGVDRVSQGLIILADFTSSSNKFKHQRAYATSRLTAHSSQLTVRHRAVGLDGFGCATARLVAPNAQLPCLQLACLHGRVRCIPVTRVVFKCLRAKFLGRRANAPEKRQRAHAEQQLGALREALHAAVPRCHRRHVAAAQAARASLGAERMPGDATGEAAADASPGGRSRAMSSRESVGHRERPQSRHWRRAQRRS